jgi:hypothetical protein
MDTKKFVISQEARFGKQASARDTMADGVPGREYDASIPKRSTSPDVEVTQGLPPGGTSMKGAVVEKTVPGDTARDCTVSANASVSKQPELSTDAMNSQAKTGSAKLANDLLSSIRNYQTALTAPAAPVASKVASDAAQAGGLELTQDVMAKIAAAVLSSEEGWALAERELTKLAGAQAARDTLDKIACADAYAKGQADADAYVAQLMQKQADDAEYARGQADAEAYVNDQMAKQALAEAYNAGRAEQAVADGKMSKQAYDQMLQKQADDRDYAQGYQQGQAYARQMRNQELVKQASATGIDPRILYKLAEEAGGVPPEDIEGSGAMGDMGGMPPGADGAEPPQDAQGEQGEISPEEIVQALQMLVQQGTLTPEDAQAVMQELSGGMDAGQDGAPPPQGGEPQGEVPPPPPPQGGEPQGMPPGMPPGMEEAGKQASAAYNRAFMDSLRNYRNTQRR